MILRATQRRPNDPPITCQAIRDAVISMEDFAPDEVEDIVAHFCRVRMVRYELPSDAD